MKVALAELALDLKGGVNNHLINLLAKLVDSCGPSS